MKALLLAGGREILAEGGLVELASFLASESGKELDPVTMIWLSGSRREPAATLSDPHEVDALEDCPMLNREEARLLKHLEKIVTEGVEQYGFLVLDVLLLGLDVNMARDIAQAAGVDVLAGVKAIFAPSGVLAEREVHALPE